jgi:hypothetical protein
VRAVRAGFVTLVNLTASLPFRSSSYGIDFSVHGYAPRPTEGVCTWIAEKAREQAQGVQGLRRGVRRLCQGMQEGIGLTGADAGPTGVWRFRAMERWVGLAGGRHLMLVGCARWPTAQPVYLFSSALTISLEGTIL